VPKEVVQAPHDKGASASEQIRQDRRWPAAVWQWHLDSVAAASRAKKPPSRRGVMVHRDRQGRLRPPDPIKPHGCDQSGMNPTRQYDGFPRDEPRKTVVPYSHRLGTSRIRRRWSRRPVDRTLIDDQKPTRIAHELTPKPNMMQSGVPKDDERQIGQLFAPAVVLGPFDAGAEGRHADGSQRFAAGYDPQPAHHDIDRRPLLRDPENRKKR